MMIVETNMHIRYPRIFCLKVGWWNDAIFKMRPFNCFIFPLIPIVRGNGDRAIVSAKLISVFPYDLYSVSFNNCNTALSQASSRSCRFLFRKNRIRKHVLYLSNIQLEYLYACSAAVHEEAYSEYQLRL